VIHFPGDHVIVKVHAQGLNWWMRQGMPPTQTIGCWTLLAAGDDWRPYAFPRGGAHLIYRVAPGLVVPTVEYDTFISTRDPATRMPPDKTKSWLDRREPTLIDWFPDLEPMRRLALDNKRTLSPSQ